MRWSRGPYRIEYRLEVEFKGPVHVGTGERLSVDSDAPVLRMSSTDCRPYIPGSGVRGVLRDWSEREAQLLVREREVIQRLFGETSRRDANVDRQGRLVVHDMVLEGSAVEIRDHVKIDRDRGAAAHGAKFDEEVVIGGRGTLVLTYEGDGPKDPEISLLESALTALENELIPLGGKSARGCGWPTVKRLVPVVHDRTTPEGLARYLASRLPTPTPEGAPVCGAKPSPGPSPGSETESSSAVHADKNGEDDSSVRGPEELADPYPWAWAKLTVKVTFDGPVLIGGPYRGDEKAGSAERETADAGYFTLVDGTPVLPGSSVRGVLRSQAERIARTLRPPANESVGKKQDDPLVTCAFGEAKAEHEQGGWKGLVSVKEGTLDGALHPVFLDHVAVDRFTGGAADRKLFSCAALASPTFTVDLLLRWLPWHQSNGSENRRTDHRDHEAAMALVLLSLRDLDAGWGWMGSRTTRGYGHVQTIEVTTAEASCIEKVDGAWKRVPHALAHPSSVVGLASWHPVSRFFERWNEQVIQKLISQQSTTQPASKGV